MAFGEADAILARRAPRRARRGWRSYEDGAVARELTGAVLGMIGGQARDIAGENGDLAALHRLKTGGCLPPASAASTPVAGVPESDQAPWRAFGDELGPLFQIVDDILDGDGVVLVHGAEGAGRPTRRRPRARAPRDPADTSVLMEIVAGLAVRTA